MNHPSIGTVILQGRTDANDSFRFFDPSLLVPAQSQPTTSRSSHEGTSCYQSTPLHVSPGSQSTYAIEAAERTPNPASSFGFSVPQLSGTTVARSAPPASIFFNPEDPSHTMPLVLSSDGLVRPRRNQFGTEIVGVDGGEPNDLFVPLTDSEWSDSPLLASELAIFSEYHTDKWWRTEISNAAKDWYYAYKEMSQERLDVHKLLSEKDRTAEIDRKEKQHNSLTEKLSRILKASPVQPKMVCAFGHDSTYQILTYGPV